MHDAKSHFDILYLFCLLACSVEMVRVGAIFTEDDRGFHTDVRKVTRGKSGRWRQKWKVTGM